MTGRLHGLTWTVLRTHRAALLGWTAFVLLGVARLLWLHRLGEEVQKHLGPCGTAPGLRPCDFGSTDGVAFGRAVDFAGGVLGWLPLAVAAFAGAALVGRELESGTAALAWSQSASPARWLAAKLALPAVVLTVSTGILTLTFRWLWTSTGASKSHAWYMDDVFRSTGPVGTAYVLLALAVGVLAGVWLQRPLPALAVAVAVTAALRTTGDLFRGYLWPKTVQTGFNAVEISHSAQQFDAGMVLGSGERVSSLTCYDADSLVDLHRCMARTGATDFYAVVHPSSHYWPLQLVESALALAVVGGLVWLAFRLLRRRVA